MFEVYRRFFFRIFLVSCLSLPVSATVVRLDIEFGGKSAGPIFIQLFDDQGPSGVVPAQGTVDNFLNYIDDNYINGGGGKRRYDGTLIHRRDSGFVIQGGGFIFDPAQGEFAAGGVTPIPVDEPILNDFDPTRSNVRGTIAMARTNIEDSATSQWFINLGDNAALLDNDNGGFTVFGRVLGNGMVLADEVDALDVVNFAQPFNELPVADVAAKVDEANVITLAKAVINPPASIFPDSTNYDFGMVSANSASAVRNVIIQNIGGQNLMLGAVGGSNGLTGPFSITAAGDNCSGKTLRSMENCSIEVEFTPVSVGDFEDSFDVSPGDVTQPGVSITVRGIGISQTPTLDIAPAVLGFGNVGNGQLAELAVTARNLGEGSLQLLAPTWIDTGGGAFSILSSGDTCSGKVLQLGQSCLFSVGLLSSSLGKVGAALEVTADGGTGTQKIQVPISANIVQLEPSIQLPTSVTVPDVRFDTEASVSLAIGNTGVDDLYVSAIDVQGVNASLFSVVSIGCVNIAVAPQTSCSVDIKFNPVAVGAFNAIVRIQSNNPEGVADVAVSATASQDADGVSDAVEQASPNGGDGNQDGIPDALQENVTSLLDTKGQYVTFEAAEGLALVNVEALFDQPPSVPLALGGESLEFQQGFFYFEVENVPIGGQALVMMYLPPGYSANSYFKFGRLPGEPSFVPAHWYVFLFDSASQTGAEFSPGTVTLHLVDGGRGDNDQVENGRIADPGGPALLSPRSSGGGGCRLVSEPGHSSGRGFFRIDLLLLIAPLLWRSCLSRKIKSNPG